MFGRGFYERLDRVWSCVLARKIIMYRFATLMEIASITNIAEAALQRCSDVLKSVVSIKLLCNFIEITLQHGCSPVNLLHIFRTPSEGWTPMEGCFWHCWISKTKYRLGSDWKLKSDEVWGSVHYRYKYKEKQDLFTHINPWK